MFRKKLPESNLTSGTLYKRIKKHWILYALFSIIAAYYILFCYIPIGMGIMISFKDFRIGNTIASAEWAGLSNYKFILKDPYILKVIRNTAEISILRLGLGFLPPVVLAIMLFDITANKLKRVSQTIVYIPHFFSWVIVYGIVYAFFSGAGFFNVVLVELGLDRINFLMSEKWFRPLLVGSAIWKELGWGTIIYLAALTSVNPELYESAYMDGAGPLRRIYHITIPSILPMISFVLTMSIGNILNVDFEQILLFYNSAVYDVADVIDTWVYRVGLGKMQYSIGSAVALMKAFVSMLLIIIANHSSRRLSGRGIW